MRGRESLPEVREGSGGPHGSPGEIRRLSRKSGRHQEALPEIREGSGGVGRPFRKSGKARDDLPKVRGGIERPSRTSGEVGSHSQKSWRGQDALPKVREGSGGPARSLGGYPLSLGGVGRPSWKFGRGREGSRVVGRPSQKTGRISLKSGRGWEDLPEVREDIP